METYWHIASVNENGEPALGHGDDRLIKVGETLTVEGEIELCENGLHACRNLIDCLRYCEGTVICEVELSGAIVHDEDKSAASSRTVLALTTAEEGEKILRSFARWCALQVIHLWDAPDVVRQYLETGDESSRAAARAAAGDAAGAAAMDAAWAAAMDAAWAAEIQWQRERFDAIVLPKLTSAARFAAVPS
jgi:hypothetical protein